MKIIFTIFAAITVFAIISFAGEKKEAARSNSKYRIETDSNFNVSLHVLEGKWKQVSSSSRFFYLFDENDDIVSDFKLSSSRKEKVNDPVYGRSELLEITAVLAKQNIELICRIYHPEKYENSFICVSSIKNTGSKEIKIGGYSEAGFRLNAKDFGADSAYKFWSFQGGSYEQRFDWIFPLTKDFKRDNYQGMNAEDYGGGMPVVDLWTKQQGIAFASLSKNQELISLPVSSSRDSGATFNLVKKQSIKILPGEIYKTVPFAVIFHKGDYFNGLQSYAKLIQAQGFKTYTSPESAFGTEWCAWGYGRNFNPADLLKTLDKVKSLGINWVTIDDGWQNNIGDWQPDKSKFPGGDIDFKKLVDAIHAKGLKVRLWWVPLTAQDSAYSAKYYADKMNEYGYAADCKISKEHPDWFLTDSSGRRVKVSWWNSYYFCPSEKGVVDYYEKFVRKAITEWGIDGFKIDGQNFNSVPECFNNNHKHSNSEESVHALPEYFKKINGLALKLKPGFIIQLCPCGTNFSIYNLPYVNQLVGSDPESSWQVRLKGKTFRALLGNKVAYSGDHVELTNHIWSESLQKSIPSGKEDFASTLAVGGVPSSKFTIEGAAQPDSSLMLNNEKHTYYDKWFGIYNKEKMSEGIYVNLYDIAYDKPETHLLEKGGSYYYTFFTDSVFRGRIELRGLKRGNYKVQNLYTGKIITEVNAADPFIQVSFKKYLLIKVSGNNN